jgi:hypothetical protein
LLNLRLTVNLNLLLKFHLLLDLIQNLDPSQQLRLKTSLWNHTAKHLQKLKQLKAFSPNLRQMLHRARRVQARQKLLLRSLPILRRLPGKKKRLRFMTMTLREMVRRQVRMMRPKTLLSVKWFLNPKQSLRHPWHRLLRKPKT